VSNKSKKSKSSKKSPSHKKKKKPKKEVVKPPKKTPKTVPIHGSTKILIHTDPQFEVHHLNSGKGKQHHPWKLLLVLGPFGASTDQAAIDVHQLVTEWTQSCTTCVQRMVYGMNVARRHRIPIQSFVAPTSMLWDEVKNAL
jgi:hypothetical protein